MSRKINLINREFRGGVVLEETNERQGGSIVYVCKCDNCGNENWELSSRRIIYDDPISCGCLDNRSIGNETHGFSRSDNGIEKVFYTTWSNINGRTCRGKIKWYYEKGISICERWKVFENFKEDMYDDFKIKYKEYSGKISIDRIDPNGDYEKSNCRWANPSIQSFNRDFTNFDKQRFIECNRKSDGHTVVICNAKMFSRMIFNTPNSHITNIANGDRGRKSEKGWTFKRIDKEEYFNKKYNGVDFIETAENFRLSIEHTVIDIEEYSTNKE